MPAGARRPCLVVPRPRHRRAAAADRRRHRAGAGHRHRGCGIGGQSWLRIYARPGRFPQAIHSAKRFRGPTGLEEYVGCGIGIALRLEVRDEALHFLSDHYFLKLGGRGFACPAWLSPGRMRVSHIDCGHGTLRLRAQPRPPPARRAGPADRDVRGARGRESGDRRAPGRSCSTRSARFARPMRASS